MDYVLQALAALAEVLTAISAIVALWLRARGRNAGDQ